MSEEKRRKTKNIAEQFNEQLTKLAYDTEKEIRQVANYYVLVYESLVGKKTDSLSKTLFYESFMLTFINQLLFVRAFKSWEKLKKFDEKLKK